MALNFVPVSLQPVFANGKLQIGAKIYVFDAGTNTPREAFSDALSGAKYSQPIMTDSSGCIPPIWVSATPIKLVITTFKDGVIRTVDNINVVGNSSGGGGGGTPSPATDIPPGFMLPAHTVGAVSGWVRANGMSIGNAVSGATERADDDTKELFKVLWGKDQSLPISGGRGANADADFAAGKRIDLPDYRGRSAVGLDGMGNALANILTAGVMTAGTGNAIGSKGGISSVTLTADQIPTHNHSGTVASTEGAHTHTGIGDSNGAHVHTGTTSAGGDHTHTINDPQHTHTEKSVSVSGGAVFNGSSFASGVITGVGVSQVDSGAARTGISVNAAADHTHTITTDTGGAHTHNLTLQSAGQHTHSINVPSFGGGAAHTNMAPFITATYYIKL